MGRLFALACAGAGADVVIHFRQSADEAQRVVNEIRTLGRDAEAIRADFGERGELNKMTEALEQLGTIDALVNNAAIFEPLSAPSIERTAWDRHLEINLTAPLMLSQAFARQLPPGREGQIINILDWRALRPEADHLPYTVSKSALAALTRSLAIALAPNIRVNGLALGAILPPAEAPGSARILDNVPLGRWARPGEAESALIFLLTAADYTTGEIIHLDGGRHLL